MIIDKRKKYFLILDTETTNNDFESNFNDGLVYDLGFVIIDRKGKIYCKRSYAIEEIFNWQELMSTAYYKNKLPIYYKKIAKGEMKKVSIWKVKQIIKQAIEYFNIDEIWAFNMNFDLTVLNNTVRYLSGSACRYFLPYGVKVCDIWNVACQVLGNQKTFQFENIRNEKGNLSTNAERMYKYITQNDDFIESHTGLEDAIIESEILIRCLKSHKKIDKNINRACWRLCQQSI